MPPGYLCKSTHARAGLAPDHHPDSKERIDSLGKSLRRVQRAYAEVGICETANGVRQL